MKKKLFSFAAICVIFAAVFAMTGCPTPDDDDGKPSGNTTTKSNDAKLTSIKFDNETATLGTPNAAHGSAIAGTVTILQSAANVTFVKSNAKATVDCAVVKSGESLDEGDLWPEYALTDLATGDTVVLKVTAENGTTILYYKIGVVLADVALATLTVGNNEVTLPPAGSTWQAAGGSAFVLFTFKASEQPEGGTVIVATTQTEGATVQYAKVTGSAEPQFANSASITFADGDYLYIKVTGTSGSAFYKVQINFVQSGTIKYGKQTFNADHSKPADLSVWNDPTLEIYPFGKVYAADSGTLLDPTQGHLDADGSPKTKAWAKALWDEEGIYIYLDVIDPDMSQVDAEHESDSFELFVNEAYPSTVYANSNPQGGGSQYRLGLNGQVSGEGGSPDAMRTLGKWASWKKDDGSGYIQVLQAPWRLRSKFISATSYRNDWEFGFELQLNIAGTTGNRYGVLVWNNVAHTNYQNANDYGVAKLIGQSGTLNYPPLPPTITSNPQGGLKSPGDSVTLTVAVETPKDGGDLSYQWFSSASSTEAGTAINGETSVSYTFTAPAESTSYYVEVTNTLNGRTATVSSGRARITIADVPMIDKLTLAQAYAVYTFELPAGAAFGDYKSITVDYFMDAENFAKGVRSLRLMGNYKESEFGNVGEYMHYAFDTANAAYIYDDIGAGAIATAGGAADTWFTITLKLNDIGGSGAPVPNGGFAATSKPASTDTGPFLFGIGIPGNSGAAKTQLVKNITMVHGTDASKNVVTKAFFGFVGYRNAPDGIYERELVPDPAGPTPATDFVMTFTPPKKNENPITARYQEIHRIDLGADFDIHQYDKLSVDIKFYDSNNALLDAGMSFATIKFKDAASTISQDFYNYGGQTPSTDWTFPVTVQEAFINSPMMYLVFDSADASQSGNTNFKDVAYIEISKVTFHVADTPWKAPELEEVTFTVDLTQDYTGTTGWTLATKSGGVLTFPAAGGAYGVIPLTQAQADKLGTATALKINVQGSANDESSFRYYLGNPGATSSWNGTNALPNNNTTGNSFTELVGEKTASFGSKSAATMKNFVLRQDTAAATVVTITSITITATVQK
jgi:hypothetical protein